MLTSNLREQRRICWLREDDVGRTGRLQEYTGKDSTNRRRLPELRMDPPDFILVTSRCEPRIIGHAKPPPSARRYFYQPGTVEATLR